MVRTFRFFAPAISALALFLAAGTGSDAQDLPLIAVYPIDIANSNPAYAFMREEQLDQGLILLGAEETLRNSRRFKVFERDKKVLASTIVTEQDRAACGATYRGEEKDNPVGKHKRDERESVLIACDLRRFAGNAAAMGQLSNVEFIVQVSIKDLMIETPTYSPIEEFPGRFRKTNNASIDVSVKVLDTTSGQIKYQGSVITSLSSKTEIVTGNVAFSPRSVWNQIATEAGRRVGNSIVGAIYPIEVVQTNGKSIVVNRGQGSGIQVGEVYEVYSIGESMKDRRTGIDLGGTETLLGDIVIRRIAEKFSVAEAVGRLSQSPAAGSILRMK
jgi:hypothetical protein